jgi:hypothetical protein
MKKYPSLWYSGKMNSFKKKKSPTLFTSTFFTFTSGFLFIITLSFIFILSLNFYMSLEKKEEKKETVLGDM